MNLLSYLPEGKLLRSSKTIVIWLSSCLRVLFPWKQVWHSQKHLVCVYISMCERWCAWYSQHADFKSLKITQVLIESTNGRNRWGRWTLTNVLYKVCACTRVCMHLCVWSRIWTIISLTFCRFPELNLDFPQSVRDLAVPWQLLYLNVISAPEGLFKKRIFEVKHWQEGQSNVLRSSQSDL